MMPNLSPNTQAILMLTAPLIAGRNPVNPDVLSPSEYKRLARHLREIQKQPADLVSTDAAEVIRACGSVIEEGRLHRLLGRGFLLSQAFERWQTLAIWVISRADPEYPARLKERLRENAPAVLYGCGERQIFGRDGLDLDRSTLADWVGKSTTLLEPLADAIGRQVLSAEAIFADDTTFSMLAPGTGKTQTARLWTYARDERPWGGGAPPAAWYRFSGDRKGQHTKDHLARYRGWMHADGYAGFEDLYRSGAIREVACMAHVRRKFVDIHRSQGSAIAEEAIGRIAQLYAVEKEARVSLPDIRVALRKAHAAPVFDDLEVWLAMQLTTISGKSPLAAAIRNALTRMERLRPYLDHGILELDNNAAERGMRTIALGRKNYLFVGSEAGGKAAAIAYIRKRPLTALGVVG
jgi:transposase